MAQLAIPMAALGAMYIISNKNKKKKEQFVANRNYLPNTEMPVRNFPKNDFENNNNIVNKFSGAKPDETYNPATAGMDTSAQTANLNKGNFTSISGKEMRFGELTHNNMVPFFGSSVTQNTKGAEGILDAYTGAGSQHIEKKAQAPLFKPQKNMQWAYGMPSTTSFVQERMKGNLTDKMNNTKPWEEVRVAPGLNKGYGTEGSGGFNSGMAAREVWQPKTVDQLRASTNPKMTYGGVVLGAHMPRASGIHGKVEKNRPDTYFINTADRWLTTTGLEKAQKARSTVPMKPENRTTTTREYYGVGGDPNQNNATYKVGKFRATHRKQPRPADKYLGGAHNSNGWEATTNDYGKDGHKYLPNNRTITGETKKVGIVSRGVYAVVAPILDLLRPSKKQNTIGNKHPMGIASGKWGVRNGRTWNPNDTLPHTAREQTENNRYIMHGKRTMDGGHQTNAHQAIENNRDTTTKSYTGGSSAAAHSAKQQSYDSIYNANLNPNKQVVSKVDRIRMGNQSLYNANINATNMRNKCTTSGKSIPNMPKSMPNIQTFGELTGKNTRERAVVSNRNSGDLLTAFNNNPYTKSLQSVA